MRTIVASQVCIGVCVPKVVNSDNLNFVSAAPAYGEQANNFQLKMRVQAPKIDEGAQEG